MHSIGERIWQKIDKPIEVHELHYSVSDLRLGVADQLFSIHNILSSYLREHGYYELLQADRD
jgi:hypothetical protein